MNSSVLVLQDSRIHQKLALLFSYNRCEGGGGGGGAGGEGDDDEGGGGEGRGGGGEQTDE